jgi:hypothetical protein
MEVHSWHALRTSTGIQQGDYVSSGEMGRVYQRLRLCQFDDGRSHLKAVDLADTISSVK